MHRFPTRAACPRLIIETSASTSTHGSMTVCTSLAADDSVTRAMKCRSFGLLSTRRGLLPLIVVRAPVATEDRAGGAPRFRLAGVDSRQQRWLLIRRAEVQCGGVFLLLGAVAANVEEADAV